MIEYFKNTLEVAKLHIPEDMYTGLKRAAADEDVNLIHQLLKHWDPDVNSIAMQWLWHAYGVISLQEDRGPYSHVIITHHDGNIYKAWRKHVIGYSPETETIWLRKPKEIECTNNEDTQRWLETSKRSDIVFHRAKSIEFI